MFPDVAKVAVDRSDLKKGDNCIAAVEFTSPRWRTSGLPQEHLAQSSRKKM